MLYICFLELLKDLSGFTRIQDAWYGRVPERPGTGKKKRLLRYTKKKVGTPNWQNIGELGNREVTDEDIRNEIKLHNQKRRFARDYVKLWWEAKVLPTGSHRQLIPHSLLFPSQYYQNSLFTRIEYLCSRSCIKKN